MMGFAAGLLIATVTAPVEVSGAVFLLPVQLNLLGVPIPSVTPTNLLYNVIAGPGALLQYRRVGHLRGPLTRLLLAGTVPGVIVGAIIRVFLLPGPQGFRVVAGLVLIAFDLWLIERTISPATRRPMTTRAVGPLALVVGVVGGLLGGHLQARLQPFMPERALRVLLGCLAVGVGALYLVEASI